MSKQAIRARRLPLSALLASVVTGAAVLLLTSGIASGSSSSAQYQYGPVRTSDPTISGSPQVGQTLTTTNGGWSSDSNVTRYTYAWGRCDANGANCVTIAGATSTTYTLVAADQSHRIRSYVTASNASGSTQAISNATDVVGSSTPTGKQIEAAGVQLPNRLVVDEVKYSANPIHARKSPTTMQVHVSDSHNNSVAGAKVFVEGLPYSRIANITETATS